MYLFLLLCFVVDNFNFFRNLRNVVLGARDLTQPDKKVISIAEKYIHPSYGNIEYGNDIMLLKVSRFSYIYISYVKIDLVQ